MATPCLSTLAAKTLPQVGCWEAQAASASGHHGAFLAHNTCLESPGREPQHVGSDIGSSSHRLLGAGANAWHGHTVSSLATLAVLRVHLPLAEAGPAGVHSPKPNSQRMKEQQAQCGYFWSQGFRV